jgi:hypothetical protein
LISITFSILVSSKAIQVYKKSTNHLLTMLASGFLKYKLPRLRANNRSGIFPVY